MKRWMTVLMLAALALPAAAQMNPQQPASGTAQKKPPLSPREQADQTFGGKKVSISYGAPSARGRKIFGEVVPYGKVWRMGANEATTLTTETDLMIGSTHVPAGKYTLYIWPSDKGMQLIINKQTGQWGTEYNKEQDLAREDMKVEKTASPVEKMVIRIDKKDEKNGTLVLEWENTKASVPVMAHGK